MPRTIPVCLRLAVCYCLIPLLLSGFIAPSITWGQTSADTEVELEFWRTIKDSDDPAMVNAYLEKYPDGDFATLATIKLKSLVGEMSSAETTFWNSVENSDDPDLLKAYLTTYPDGDFAVLANIKINKLEEDSPDNKLEEDSPDNVALQQLSLIHI